MSMTEFLDYLSASDATHELSLSLADTIDQRLRAAAARERTEAA
jgi:hypothetical protein